MRWCTHAAMVLRFAPRLQSQGRPPSPTCTDYPPNLRVYDYTRSLRVAKNLPIEAKRTPFIMPGISPQTPNERTVMPTQETTNMIELRHFFVTPGVAAAHALSGVAIFAGAGSVLKTTPLYLLGLIVQNPINVAIIVVVTAVLAIIPYLMREPRRSWFMLLILPQQCLLLMHFVSAGLAIMSGHYHDGYVPNGGSAFIFADQIWLLMVVIVHTLEYIEAL
jgi:hypothetical protein